jgi:hypothetical protein
MGCSGLIPDHKGVEGIGVSAAIELRETMRLNAARSRDHRLPRKNQAGGRAMGEQTPVCIGHPTLSGPNPTTAGQDDPFGPNQTGLGRDRPHQRNLEFKRRLADASLEF